MQKSVWRYNTPSIWQEGILSHRSIDIVNQLTDRCHSARLDERDFTSQKRSGRETRASSRASASPRCSHHISASRLRYIEIDARLNCQIKRVSRTICDYARNIIKKKFSLISERGILRNLKIREKLYRMYGFFAIFEFHVSSGERRSR